MFIQVITLFPEMFKGVFESSMLWKAQNNELTKLEVIDLRQFGIGSRKTVDDTPYGGGDGMLIKPEPLFEAIEHAKTKSEDAKVLLMTPRGYDFEQKAAERLASEKNDLIIVCGRYEGYDERIVSIVDEQICIGHYVLTGGELPAMVVVDSVVRLIPGVLGGSKSAEIESFSNGKLIREFPQYTRPEEFRGMKVPRVLLSGNHGEIEKWRKDNEIRSDE